jgi:hypothetical protein
MRLWLLCACALAELLSAKAASAQGGVYVLFTGANLDTTQTVANIPITTPPTFTTSTTATRIYGPTIGFFGNLPMPVVKLGADVRGSLLNGSGSQQYYAVAGPRIEVDLPKISLHPYAEGLIGGGNYLSLADTKTAFKVEYEFLVGADRKLIAILHWRILEFSYTKDLSGDIPTKALSSGLVLRFP